MSTCTQMNHQNCKFSCFDCHSDENKCFLDSKVFHLLNSQQRLCDGIIILKYLSLAESLLKLSNVGQFSLQAVQKQRNQYLPARLLCLSTRFRFVNTGPQFSATTSPGFRVRTAFITILFPTKYLNINLIHHLIIKLFSVYPTEKTHIGAYIALPFERPDAIIGRAL